MKTVLITGGNKGIGLTTTKIFLDKGFHVIVVARDFSSFPLKNNNLQKITFDLSAYEKIPQLVEKIGPVDVLINNAGIMHSLPYDSYPKENVASMMNVNLRAPIALITEVAKGMMHQGKGRIVNTASVAGEIGHPDIWYGITKAGLINATKSFAKLLGPKGIVINCVAPGPVEGTDLFTKIPEERKETIKKSVISGRFAKTSEVAQTIYWLAVESPEYINGTCIDINNGAFMR